jgi:hypothetical protein
MYFHGGMKNDSLGIWGTFVPELVQPLGFFSDCLLFFFFFLTQIFNEY